MNSADKQAARGGPFPEIFLSVVSINCMYFTTRNLNFVGISLIDNIASCRLSVVCNFINPNNLIPVYTKATTFDEPTILVKTRNSSSFSVINANQLPNLLLKVSSDAFSRDLLSHLLRLKQREEDAMWTSARKLMLEKISTLPDGATGSQDSQSDSMPVPSLCCSAAQVCNFCL